MSRGHHKNRKQVITIRLRPISTPLGLFGPIFCTHTTQLRALGSVQPLSLASLTLVGVALSSSSEIWIGDHHPRPWTLEARLRSTVCPQTAATYEPEVLPLTGWPRRVAGWWLGLGLVDGASLWTCICNAAVQLKCGEQTPQSCILRPQHHSSRTQAKVRKYYTR
jgi:hypothetical protein